MTSARSRSHTADVDAADDRMPDHPIKPTNFRKYAKSPLMRYVLSIIPVGAKLKATSKLTADHLGKIPGLISDNGEWTGFPWGNHVTKQTTLEIYEAWQVEQRLIIPLGLRLGDILVGLDLDIENILYRDLVWRLAEKHFGITPVVRCRDGSVRVVLFYRRKSGTPPIRKFAGAYLDTDGQKQLTEMLGDGQQVVAEGPHAKGKMHYWFGGTELVDHLHELPEITSEMVSAFYVELNDLSVNVFGFTKHKLALPGSGNRPANKVADPESPHLAPDRDLLTRALEPIDLDDPSMDYDAFIKLLRAICASVGGDLDYLHEVVWPWVCTNQQVAHGQGPRTEEQGIEWLKERWVSFTDSTLGAEYVYGIAADSGFPDGLAALDALKAKDFEDAYTIAGLASDTGDAGGAEAALEMELEEEVVERLLPAPRRSLTLTAPSRIYLPLSIRPAATPQTKDGSSLRAEYTSRTIACFTPLERCAAPSATRTGRKGGKGRK